MKRKGNFWDNSSYWDFYKIKHLKNKSKNLFDMKLWKNKNQLFFAKNQKKLKNHFFSIFFSEFFKKLDFLKLFTNLNICYKAYKRMICVLMKK